MKRIVEWRDSSMCRSWVDFSRRQARKARRQADRHSVARASGRRVLFESLEARHLLAGDLDLSFGEGGIVTTELLNNRASYEEAYAAAVDSEERIVAAGRGGQVFRYDRHGALDDSFGDGGSVKFPGNVAGVLIQDDGAIVVAGGSFDCTRERFLVVADFPDGTRDSSFGNRGMVTTTFESLTVTPGGIALHPDGGLVVAGGGRSAFGGATDIVMARYMSDGTLDPSFGSGGRVVSDLGESELAESVVIQPDGKIIIGRLSQGAGNLQDFAVARYQANGVRLDPTFANGGKLVFDFMSSDEMIRDVTVQEDGEIIVAGRMCVGSTYDFAIVAYVEWGFGSDFRHSREGADRLHHGE